MKKSINPIAALAVIGIVVIAAAMMVWKGTQKTVRLPDKPPSGPIVLPASQQGRMMPSGPTSGPMPTAPQ